MIKTITVNKKVYIFNVTFIVKCSMNETDSALSNTKLFSEQTDSIKKKLLEINGNKPLRFYL